MFLNPFRLISWLLALLIIGVPLTIIAFFLLVLAGSPGSCEAEDRPITYDALRAVSFQEKWGQLDDALNADQLSAAVFDESEATSRARIWADEHDVPVSDLYLCFSPEGGAISGEVDIPFFPGDVDVLIRGTMDLTGERAEFVVEEIEVGRLPGPLTDLVEGFINNLIDDQTEDLELSHDYGLTFGEGEVTVSGQP